MRRPKCGTCGRACYYSDSYFDAPVFFNNEWVPGEIHQGHCSKCGSSLRWELVKATKEVVSSDAVSRGSSHSDGWDDVWMASYTVDNRD